MSPPHAGLPHRTGPLLSQGQAYIRFLFVDFRFAAGFLPTPQHCDAVAFGYRFRFLRHEEDSQVQCHAWHTWTPAAAGEARNRIAEQFFHRLP